MGKMPFLPAAIAAGLLLSLWVAPAEAQRYSRGSGTAAVIGFAAGAIAGTVLSSPPPPPPPRVIHYHHGYDPYGPPMYYGYPPPMVQREIIYRDRPTPVIIQQAPVIQPPPMTSTQYAPMAPPRETPPAPTAVPSGPTFTPTPVLPSTASAAKPAPGTLVDRLPTMARRVDRGGVMYFEEDGVHYLPVTIANQPKFVVVQVQ